jgi:hypothetical protein
LIENGLSSTPPVRLDTWGLEPADYRLNQDLHSLIRQPSPLTNYGLGNKSQKQKKVMNKKEKGCLIYKYLLCC